MTGPADPGRKLRIAVIGHPGSSHIRNRVQAFARRGHEMILLTHEHPDAQIQGVRVLAVREHPRAFARLAAIHDAYVRALRALKPDAVHVHFAQGLAAWSAAWAGPWPLIVTAMGGDVLFDEQGDPGWTQRWATLELLRAADVITPVSD